MQENAKPPGGDDIEAGWSRLVLGDALTADPQLSEIEAQFKEAYARAGRPLAMALFKRHDTEHSLHCIVTVYFSPAARGIGRRVGATPCAAPTRANLELAAGDQSSWTQLFAAPREARNPARGESV